MNYAKYLEEISQHVTGLFGKYDESLLYYHNISHTRFVVSATKQIADHYRLNERDFFVVMCAAWFHDTGYLTGPAESHEERSATMAELFFIDNETGGPIIDEIKECIMSTKMPQHPVGILQQILCDADMFHLGTEDFLEKSKNLRKELGEGINGHISKDGWRNENIRLLKNHEYNTDYVRQLLNDKKKENADMLSGKPEEKKHHETPNDFNGDPELELLYRHFGTPKNKSMPDKENEKKKKENHSERSVDTVFKIISSNNQRLSSQADSKAHIMIQVNSIIVSVLLSLILRKIEENQSLAIPTFMLLLTNLHAIIFSVLATRPNVPHGTFTLEDLKTEKVNLLFFGNFYKMRLSDYSSGMRKMLNNSDFLYESLIQDVYFQGIVLGKKYKLLRISYNIFMFGLIGSILSFMIAIIAIRKN